MTKNRKLGTKIVMVILGALLLLTLFGGCAAEEAKKTIIFGEGDWDSINIHNGIAAFILEHGYGYEIEYIFGSEYPLAVGVIGGDIDVVMEGWMQNIPETYDPPIADGTIIDAGACFPESWQGWVIPRYMVEGDAERGIEPMAPGLKSVSDLPQYWELFKDPEQPTKGRIYDCVPGWRCADNNAMKLVSEGLEDYYVLFNPGSGYALAAAMEGAYIKGNPYLGYYWEPSVEMGRLDMYKLEDEPYDAEVWNEDCSTAFPATPVDILINGDFAEREPVVVEFLREYITTTELTQSLMAHMADNELDTKEAALYFLREYESIWTAWVSSDVASKVRAALD